MDLEDAGCRARFMIRDRDGKYPALFDTVLEDAGIEVVLSGIRMPRMNALMKRWVQTCRRELLDRTLLWNQRHLLHALREFEQHYNSHRPHQGIADARPLHPLPPPITDPDAIAHLDIRRRAASAAPSTSTSRRADLHGRDSRQGQDRSHRRNPPAERRRRHAAAAHRLAALSSPHARKDRRTPHLAPGAQFFVVVGCAAPLREQIACDHGRRRVFRPVERECPAPREMQGQGARSRQVKNRQVGEARTA